MTALADEGLKLMEAMYITIGFAWKPEAHVDVKRVELLISKAEDIYQDHFDHSQEPLIENDKCTTYTLEQWNTEGGSYCACPSLEPGVYQFVFRVDNGTERELQISDYYERTFLGNGRPVNYIELIENSEVDRSTLAVGKRNIIRSRGGSSGTTSSRSKKSFGSDRESSLNSSSDANCTTCTLL